MRLASLALLLPQLVACSGDDGDGESEPPAEVIEFPFDVELGEQRAVAWAIKPLHLAQCWSLALPDGVFHMDAAALFKRGPGPQTDSPQWVIQVPFSSAACPDLHPTPDGGVVLADAYRVVRVAENGTILWDHPIVDLEYTGIFGSALLTNGNVAVTHTYKPPAGSLDVPSEGVIILDPDGNQLSRTVLPTVHVASADSVGSKVAEDHPPGLGGPSINSLAPSTNGGVVATGNYNFATFIACGTEADPQPTESGASACTYVASNGLVARIDASGKLLWAKRLGNAYATLDVGFGAVAQLSDGSTLATGLILADPRHVFNPHIHALATRYDGDGNRLWSRAYPWGLAPGARFLEGTNLDTIAPRDGGAADVVLHAPRGNSCRLLRFQPSGEFSRVQILDDPTGSMVVSECNAQAVGADIGYRASANDSWYVVKLAP